MIRASRASRPPSRRRPFVAIGAILLALPWLLAGAGEAGPPVTAQLPDPALGGVVHPVGVTARDGASLADAPVRILDDRGRQLAAGRLDAGGALTLDVRIPRQGGLRIEVDPFDAALHAELRRIPGWFSLLPPLLAILIALIFRQVVPALATGIWVGAWIVHGDPLAGLLRAIDRYVVNALTDADHAAILVFSLMLGGMVGVVSRGGGMVGLIESLAPYATTARRGQLVTWLLGVIVFFDDYANTLLVGNTMRPVTDRLKISREKLAYIVDSTAAPVACVALVSTWIGYEVSLIGDALREIGSGAQAYGVFLKSLPYNFYPFLALVFGLTIASGGRDFGPMRRAESRAASGRLLGLDAVPLADFDSEALAPPSDRPRRWINAVLPVLVVLVTTFVALWWTGREALATSGDPLSAAGLTGLGFRGVGAVFGAGDSFRALLWASLLGCLVAIALVRSQRILSLGDALGAWTGGVKAMTYAFVILVLAWAIADICSALNTRGFMVASLSEHLDPRLLPSIVFVLASITAFSTGTSWGTMGILIPLAVPTAYGLSLASGGAPDGPAVLASISAVLAGAIFGDHCSPISDTTVLSSMASGCDHVDHVRTQLPYALTVGTASIVFGYLPAGFHVSPWLCLLGGSVLLVLVVRWLGRPPVD